MRENEREEAPTSHEGRDERPSDRAEDIADGPADPPETSEQHEQEIERRQDERARRLADAEERKVKARKRPEQSVWFGLGAFGLVGWSVAIPTLLFLALGIWIDANYPSRFSWTLMLLFGGIIVGCLNAWYWVNREREEIERRRDEPDGD